MSDINSVEALRAVIGDKIEALEEKNIDHLDSFAIEFIEKSPFLILSTADDAGRCDASPKGDAPGFVEVVDSKTLLIPDRPGNKLAYGHENILKNPRIGLLFCIPGTNETLRVNGTAQLSADPALLEKLAARGKPAVLVIRVNVEECFFHCGKAFIRSELWSAETWDEPHKVSFGAMFAARKNLDKDVERMIDDSIATDYEENL